MALEAMFGVTIRIRLLFKECFKKNSTFVTILKLRSLRQETETALGAMFGVVTHKIEANAHTLQIFG